MIVLSSRSVHDGRVVKLSLEEVRLPNGNTVTLELIRHPGAAAVVPVDHDGNAILVRQYRHATGSWLLEVPRGSSTTPVNRPRIARCARSRRRPATARGASSPGLDLDDAGVHQREDLALPRAGAHADARRSPARRGADRGEAPRSRRPRGAPSAGEIVDGKSVCALLRASGVGVSGESVGRSRRTARHAGIPPSRGGRRRRGGRGLRFEPAARSEALRRAVSIPGSRR